MGSAQRARGSYCIQKHRFCIDPNATLDDVREGMETFEDLERTARRVFGGAHPFTMRIEYNMQKSRAALRAREALGTA